MIFLPQHRWFFLKDWFKTSFSNKNFIIFITILCLFFTLALEHFKTKQNQGAVGIKTFNTLLQQLRKETDSLLSYNYVKRIIKNDLTDLEVKSLYDKPYTIAVLDNKKKEPQYVFWSNSNYVLPESFVWTMELRQADTLVVHRNIHYELRRFHYKIDTVNYVAVAYLPIYRRYPVSSEFFSDGFPLLKEMNGNYRLTDLPSDLAVYYGNGKKMMNVKDTYNVYQQSFGSFFCVFYTLLFIFWFFLWANFCASLIKKRAAWQGLLYCLLGLLAWSGVTLFGSQIMWQFWWEKQYLEIRQLGFYSIILFGLVLFVVKNGVIFFPFLRKIEYWSLGRRLLYAAFMFVSGYGVLAVIDVGLHNLIMSSQVSFDLIDVVSLSRMSIWGIISVMALLYSFMLSLWIFTEYMLKTISWFWIISIILASTVVFYLLIGLNYVVLSGIVYLFVLFKIIISKEENESRTYIRFLTWVLFFACHFSILIYIYEKEKSLLLRTEIARTISMERDFDFEQRVSQIVPALLKDQFASNYFNRFLHKTSDIEQRLNLEHIDEAFYRTHFYKYRIFDKTGQAIYGDTISLTSYWNSIQNLQKISDNYLYTTSDSFSTHKYLVRLNYFDDKGLALRTIIITFTAKPRLSRDVYLDILMQRKQRETIESYDYDYALYKKGNQVYNEGTNLPKVLTKYDIPNNPQWVFFENDREYVAIKFGADRIAIVGKPIVNDAFYMLSLFSYLLTLGIVILAIIMFINQWVNTLPSKLVITLFSHHTFRSRLQLAIIGVVIGSFLAISAISIIFFNKVIYSSFESKRLEQRVLSLMQHANSILPLYPNLLNSEKEQEAMASTLANTHNLVVNLFSLEGKLLKSSREDFYERRFLSTQMNPLAFSTMRQRLENLYIVDESIGDYKYSIAYTPLINEKNNELLAFVGLPFDSQQSVISRRESVKFLLTLLNVYLLLIIIGIVVAAILASSITKPLTLIAEKIKSIRLLERNEPLYWQSKDDEIGQLVNRYNQMIRQITESTVQLAQSQKEVAWREMAKQVAHEIKNPLTPMKLSLQLLQRAAKSSSPEDFKAMVERLSISLLEQIDGLADIATAFSNFARMPEAQNENLNLNELVASTFELFRNDAAEIDMHLEICFEICQIYADKTQIIRVLNNLIKNAIQAIPENQKGKITVALITQNQNAIIHVTDNGQGIAPEKTANIFVPNFTTKSSGMGLGLAMSKNIIEAASGTLQFHSVPNVQTTFTISLPLIYD